LIRTSNSSIQVLGQEQHALSIRTATLDVEQRTQLQNALSEKIGVLIRKPRLTQLVPPLVANFSPLGYCSSPSLELSSTSVCDTVGLRRDDRGSSMMSWLRLGFSQFGSGAGVEVDSLFIVALLTLAGFSVNDTVVIYDRIRRSSK